MVSLLYACNTLEYSGLRRTVKLSALCAKRGGHPVGSGQMAVNHRRSKIAGSRRKDVGNSKQDVARSKQPRLGEPHNDRKF